MKKLVFLIAMSATLVGCTSQAQRMAECEAQGVSRDACYIADQNRQATINAAAQKQAMENAQALYPVQKAQSAHKGAKVKQWQGMKLVVSSTGLSVDGKPATVVEKEEKATVYQQGLYKYLVYSNGKIAVTDTEGVLKGYAQ